MSDSINWLMDGDPVIRWQTMRDILDAPENEWQAERQRTIDSGWGKQFIDVLKPDHTWPDGRWTGTIWTLLQVMDCGLPADHPALNAAAAKFLNEHLTLERSADNQWLLKRLDLCHVGFWLRVGAYFVGKDERFTNLVNFILSVQMDDGGWNCRIRNYPKTCHSSFHTTFNILEGLSQAADVGIIEKDIFRASEQRALEFMLAHQLYRSDKTGEIVDERLTHFTYPSHWHYNVLRGLDYIRNTPSIHDPRLADPIAMLESKRAANGKWPVEKRISGVVHFDMDKFGGESRWTTLKSLRILKAAKTTYP